MWASLPSMTVHEVSSKQFSDNLEREIDKVVAQHEVLRVRREGGDFVVVSADDWRSIEETLSLSKIPGLVESLHEAAREPIDEGTRLEDLDW
jgi:antitoxin YefM